MQSTLCQVFPVALNMVVSIVISRYCFGSWKLQYCDNTKIEF